MAFVASGGKLGPGGELCGREGSFREQLDPTGLFREPDFTGVSWCEGIWRQEALGATAAEVGPIGLNFPGANSFSNILEHQSSLTVLRGLIDFRLEAHRFSELTAKHPHRLLTSALADPRTESDNDQVHVLARFGNGQNHFVQA